MYLCSADTLQEADFKVMSLAECNAELSPSGGYVTNSNICVRSEKSAGCKVNLPLWKPLNVIARSGYDPWLEVNKLKSRALANLFYFKFKTFRWICSGRQKLEPNFRLEVNMVKARARLGLDIFMHDHLNVLLKQRCPIGFPC